MAKLESLVKVDGVSQYAYSDEESGDVVYITVRNDKSLSLSYESGQVLYMHSTFENYNKEIQPRKVAEKLLGVAKNTRLSEWVSNARKIFSSVL